MAENGLGLGAGGLGGGHAGGIEVEALVGTLREFRAAHDLGELAERLIVLHDGRIVASGPRDEIKRDPRVAEIYLGTDESARPRTDESAHEA